MRKKCECTVCQQAPGGYRMLAPSTYSDHFERELKRPRGDASTGLDTLTATRDYSPEGLRGRAVESEDEDPGNTFHCQSPVAETRAIAEQTQQADRQPGITINRGRLMSLHHFQEATSSDIAPDAVPPLPKTHHDLPFAVRAAYLEAAIDRRNHVSHVETDRNLKRRKLYAQGVAASVGANDPLADENFTTNTRTALRHLGVDPDTLVDRYIVCPDCFNLTPYADLYTLDDQTCTAMRYKGRDGLRVCGTELYTSTGNTRVPTCVMPITPMSRALQYLFQDEAFVSNLQSWRKEGDDDIESPHEGPHKPVLDPRDSYTDNAYAMQGLADGAAWRSQAAFCEREVAEDFAVQDSVNSREMMRHDLLKYGLKLVLNMDRFRVDGMIGYSVGGIYASVANLPRHMVYKRRYTTLLALMPGHREPSRSEMNRVLEVVVADLQKCEKGIRVWIDGVLHDVQCRVILCTSDTPASKKILNAAGARDSNNPCHYCRIPFAAINTIDGYRPGRLPAKGVTSDILQSIFSCQGASDTIKCASWEDYGFRYSEIMKLVGFEPSLSTPLDPMHNSFLGLTMSFINMLYQNDLLPGEQGEAFRKTFANASYPSHLGRAPERVAEQLKRRPGKKKANDQPATEDEFDNAGNEREDAEMDRNLGNGRRRMQRQENGVEKEKRQRETKVGGGLKADHWKRVLQLLPLALFNAWRIPGTNDIIEMTDEDLADEQRAYDHERNIRAVEMSATATTSGKGKSKRKSKPAPVKVSRDRREWYSAGLGLSAALRSLHSHYISYDEASAAVETLAVVSRKLLTLKAHLTINWHAAMHYAEFIHLYGPLSGYSTWAFERHNGWLSHVAHNKKPSEVPTTLMRAWLGDSRLTAVLNNPAPDASVFERQTLEVLLAENNEAIRGTMMMEELQRDLTHQRLNKPIAGMVDLEREGVYDQVLAYLQNHHSEHGFEDFSVGMYQDNVPLLPKRSALYQMHALMERKGYKFCAPQYDRTVKNRHALVRLDPPDTDVSQQRSNRPTFRAFGRIEMLLSIDGLWSSRSNSALHVDLAVVHIFDPVASHDFPWHERTLECGIRICSDHEGSAEVFPISALEAPTIYAGLQDADGTSLSMSFSCDMEDPEPESYFDMDDDDEEEELGHGDRANQET